MDSPNSHLRVSMVQTSLVWENPAANCAILEEKLQALQGKTDVVVLPEMFLTGFSMSAEGADFPKGVQVQWMQMMANRLDVLLIGSLKIKENNQFYNRLLAVFPDGKIVAYNKRHLFRMGNEHQFYSPGEEHGILSFKSWKIALFVCYDLRFPVWSRNVQMAYDLAIYVANWPAVRAHAWSTLLKARAIENLAYVVGVNRVGKDANDLDYQGDSVIVSFKGEEIVHLWDEDTIQTSSISKESLQEFRDKFPAHLDADAFELN
ncbi:amidohydrolase [Aquirufa aurantiipilula]|uniref:Amidohydrolase n=1 Tax=Aquirufa aurantiipilula TaxID=2696561 RepID=A0ABT6BLP5_9BACT|nr:amidohydrolase [Aquirufa aurantiipilula]MDF5691397.1 amidohydrolase [Aquirufa aurantiipilula]